MPARFSCKNLCCKRKPIWFNKILIMAIAERWLQIKMNLKEDEEIIEYSREELKKMCINSVKQLKKILRISILI